jgi:hypothetical protein
LILQPYEELLRSGMSFMRNRQVTGLEVVGEPYYLPPLVKGGGRNELDPCG